MLRIKFAKKAGLHEASRFTSDTLGYGAIAEGREGACIVAIALASPSALQVTPRAKPQNRVFCVTTARPGGSSLLGHQASLRLSPIKPRRTQPNPAEPNRTTKKPHHAQLSFSTLFSAAEPRRTTPNHAKPRQTTPNPAEPAGGAVSAAA